MNNNEVIKSKYFKKELGLDIYKEVESFVYSFLQFMNSREVEIVRREYSTEDRIKQVNKGRLPKKAMDTIRVSETLKVYLDDLKNKSGGHIDYSHAFWVRGHFRTLRDEKRYGDSVGKKMWIMPFIKGTGILIEKNYLLRGGEGYDNKS